GATETGAAQALAERKLGFEAGLDRGGKQFVVEHLLNLLCYGQTSGKGCQKQVVRKWCRTSRCLAGRWLRIFRAGLELDDDRRGPESIKRPQPVGDMPD